MCFVSNYHIPAVLFMPLIAPDRDFSFHNVRNRHKEQKNHQYSYNTGIKPNQPLIQTIQPNMHIFIIMYKMLTLRSWSINIIKTMFIRAWLQSSPRERFYWSNLIAPITRRSMPTTSAIQFGSVLELTTLSNHYPLNCTYPSHLISRAADAPRLPKDATRTIRY